MDGLDARGNPRRSLWGFLYIAAIIMGALYLTDVAQTRSLAGATDGLAAYTWQWTLFIGGITGLVGNLMPRHHFRIALTVESAGAMSTAIMIAIYVSTLSSTSIGTTPWATIVWMSSIAAGLAGRVIECMRQRSRAIAYKAVREIIDQNARG